MKLYVLKLTANLKKKKQSSIVEVQSAMFSNFLTLIERASGTDRLRDAVAGENKEMGQEEKEEKGEKLSQHIVTLLDG